MVPAHRPASNSTERRAASRVPNASYVYQIEKNYILFLCPIISQLYGQQTRLHYAVPKAEAPKLDTETDSTAIRASLRRTIRQI